MNKKKLLALLMALVMTLTLVPVTAFATEVFDAESAVAEVLDGETHVSYHDGLQSAIDDAESGATIKLLADTDLGEGSSTLLVFPAGKQLILDLNGYKLSGKTNGVKMISNLGTLTIKDTSAGKTGEIANISNGNNDCTRTLGNGSDNNSAATLTIDSGKISSTVGQAVINQGIMTLNDGAVLETTANYSGDYGNGAVVIDNRATGVLNVNGATLRSDNGMLMYLFSGGTVHITGGTFTSNADRGILGGAGAKTAVVTGGTFNMDPSAIVAEGYYVEEENSLYTVKQLNYSNATVTTFAELKTALESATNTAPVAVTIQSGCNIAVTESITLPKNSTMTVNGLLTITDGTVFVADGSIVNNNQIIIEENGFLSRPASVQGNGFLTYNGYDCDAETYEISTPMDFQWLSTMSTEYDTTALSVELENEITMPAGVEFEQIPWFVGVFDGKGHTISNITMLAVSSYNGPFLCLGFAEEGSLFKDVTFNVNLASNNGTVGGVAGYAYQGTQFENVKVTGSISVSGSGYGAAGFVGAMVGEDSTGVISFANCENAVNISAPNAQIVGGFYGTATSCETPITVTDCVNSGDITSGGYAASIGGFMSYQSTGKTTVYGHVNIGVLTGSYTTGKIQNNQMVLGADGYGEVKNQNSASVGTTIYTTFAEAAEAAHSTGKPLFLHQDMSEAVNVVLTDADDVFMLQNNGKTTNLNVTSTTGNVATRVSTNITIYYVAPTNVARIGTTNYATLQDAINAAVTQSQNSNSKVTVELLDNVTDGTGLALFNTSKTVGGMTYPAATSANVEIDFGGHTYTVAAPAVGSTGTENQALHFESGNTVTLTNGTINMTNDSNKLAAFNMIMQNYGNLTIDNMTIDGTGIAVATYGSNYSSTWAGTTKPQFNFNNSGISLIHNSTITVIGDMCIDDTANVTIKANAVINANKIVTKGTDDRLSDANPTITVENGAQFKLANGVSEFEALLNPSQTLGTADSKGVYTVAAAVTYVAQIGNDKYETLAEAIANVKDNETIELLGDLTISQVITVDNGKTFTLDLKGYTLNATSGRTFNIKNAFVTVKNGAMTGSSQPFNVIGSADSNYDTGAYNTLTLENDLTVNGEYAVILWYPVYDQPAYGTHITVDGATLNGNIWVLGTIAEGNSVIDVKSGTSITVSEESSSDGAGIALQGFATVNVEDGVTVTAPTGIEVAGGTLNVTGGTIRSNVTPTNVVEVYNGTTTTGAAIAVAPYNYTAPHVNISGGTISGYTALNIANPRKVTDSNKMPVISVSGGIFEAIGGGEKAVNCVDGSTGFISGGTFDVQPAVDLIKNGYQAVDNGDGTWTVSPADDYTAAFASSTTALSLGSTTGTSFRFSITKNGTKLTKTDDYTAEKNNWQLVYNPDYLELTEGPTASGSGLTYKLKGIKAGTTTITFRNKADQTISASVDVTINHKVTLAYSRAFDAAGNKFLVENGAQTISKITFDGTEYTGAELESFLNDYTLSVEGDATINGLNVIPSAAGDVYVTVTKNGDPTVTARSGKIAFVNGAAQIGDNYYATLDNALKAAQDGDTVKLINSVTESISFSNNQAKIAEGFKLTIDLNGNTWTATSSSDYALRVDYGIVTIKDSNGTGEMNHGKNYAIMVGHLANSLTSKIIIESGTFTGKTSVVQVGISAGGTKTNPKTYYGGELEILGGTFVTVADTGETYDANDNFKYTLNMLDMNDSSYASIYSPSSITVKGGTFYKFNPANCAAEGENTNFVAEGYKAVELTANNGWYQVGKVEATATAKGDPTTNNQVTYTVDTVVMDKNDAIIGGSASTDMQVTVNGTDSSSYSNVQTDSAKQPVGAAALSQLVSEKVGDIVAAAVEAAGANAANNMSINVVLVSDDGTQTMDEQDSSKVTKVTYEVHPEAIVYSDQNAVIGSYHITNGQLNGTFSFKLKATNITGVVPSDKILVTHVLDTGNTEELGPFTVDSEGYIEVTDVTEFSEFTLEEIKEDTVWAKYSYSLTLEDSIKINFKVKDLQDNPGNYTVAYGFGETKDDSWTVATLEYADLNSFEIGSFAAKEMGKEVHVIVYHGSDMIKDAKYSVKKYCETVINGNYGAEITALCKATLDYGRYAQEAFNYETGALVNGGNDYFTNSNIVVPADTSTKTPNGSYVTGVSLSLITTAETQLVARFKTPVMPTDVTINGTSDNSWVYADGVVKVTATGISAVDLDKDVTFVVSDGSGSYTYTVSPTYYMYLAISKNSQVSLNRAFYNYYLKAEAYFATK